jgi:hypothetical protein
VTDFSSFSSVSPRKCEDNASDLVTHFELHYLLIILLFESLSSELLKGSLNKPKINKAASIMVPVQ